MSEYTEFLRGFKLGIGAASETVGRDLAGDIAANGTCPECGETLRFIEKTDDGRDLMECPNRHGYL